MSRRPLSWPVHVLPALLLASVAHGATFTVTSVSDLPDTNTGDGVCAVTGGGCTLRAAIQQANASAGTDTIAFSIPGPRPHNIVPASAFNDITGPVVLDGATEPDYTPGNLAIVLNGASAGAGANGLRFAAGSSGSTLRAVVVQAFAGNGVVVASDNNSLVRDYAGTNVAGTAAVANGGVGFQVTGSGNTLGGANYDERIIAAGNTGRGVVLSGSSNTLAFSFVGTSWSGLAAIGNGGHGVEITGGIGNALRQAVISGNAGDGLRISGGSAAIVEANNLFGLNQPGVVALPNTGNGISIVSSNANRIGPGNIISGNLQAGVALSGTASSNLVQGNYIGLALGGATAIGNGGAGVTLTGVSSNSIGGLTTGTGNVISGNGGNGVTVTGGSNNAVQSNVIGLLTGDVAAGNGGHGIAVDNSANLDIGLTAEGPGNFIVASGGDGVHAVGAGTTSLLIAGNNLGGVHPGTASYGNTGHGAYLSDVSGATIGGDISGEDNVIGFNHLDGISINGGSGTLLKTNEIGVETAGVNSIGNLGSGIVLTNHVGATLTFNLVGHNGGDGIRFVGGGGHVLHGMQVGLTLAGTAAAPNAGNGLTVDNSANNAIGEPFSGGGNLFCGNGGHGIVLRGAGATGNTIKNDLVGTNAGSTGPVPNGGWGILIDGASNNAIGGATVPDGNLVAYNGTGGIAVLSGNGNLIRATRIRANSGIGIDLDGDGALPADSVTPNDVGDSDGGGNRRQNYPVLLSSTATSMSGTLRAAPSTSYTVDGFVSAVADPSGFGEAESWMGGTSVSTDVNGLAAFTLNFPAQPAGSFYTATATAPTLDTSEVSRALILGGSASPNELFVDGFETGAPNLWSATNP